MADYSPGALISARGREWIVTAARPPLLTLRPLAGGEETVIHTGIEPPRPAVFQPPNAGSDIGSHTGARLLADAARLKLKDGAGPFRSLGRLAFEPRLYQYVPLLMALQQRAARLLIADDVGIGKTIEAGMIAAELLARGDIRRLAVLCPPHLCDQWRQELRDKFNLTAQPVTAALAPRLEREIPHGHSVFHHYPCTVVSLDFIKSDRRRSEFVAVCPECVIIDEAHTRIWRGGRHQGYRLLQDLAADENRHMIFLTATPHSGDESGFFNLLALLDPDFQALETATGKARQKLRDRLGQHFVQRMRHDIIGSDAGDNPFPRREEAREIHYTADGSDYGALLADILSYCRRLARRQEAQTTGRMTYWSMLALMRCAASSPRAAEAALKNRIAAPAGAQSAPPAADAAEAENDIRRHITDGGEEDAGGDLPPAVHIPEPAPELAGLIERAKAIADAGDDPKLNALLREVDGIMKQGRHPIIFCRYIATAHYIAAHLKARDKKYHVCAVTGDIPPASRAGYVQEAGEQANRILVATDCLSEGVNLQEYFDSVIHYDLSWNPTRHQQREGRADRLGQRSRTVQTVMLYGRDNPVDGAVLQVIIRKAERIRRELGVYVPLPDDEESMTEALLRAVCLHSEEKEQLELFAQLPEAKRIENAWAQASARHKARRTLFAQSRLKPADILPEQKLALEKLGDAETVQRFMRAALQKLDIAVSADDRGGMMTVNYNNSAGADLSAWLPIGKSELCFALPAPPGALYLHRAHPLARRCAELFFESALLPASPLARRAGAFYSGEVSRPVTVAIIRMRHQLRAGSNIQLAEEIAIVRIEEIAGRLVMTADEDSLRLLDAAPAGNIAPGRRQLEIERALEQISALQAELNALAEERAGELKEAHDRVRRAAARKSGILGADSARSSLPPDIIGVYAALPYAGSAAGSGGEHLKHD